MTSPATRCYSTSEAARRMDVSPDRVRQLLRTGRIPFTPTPLGRLLDADAVDALVAVRVRKPQHGGSHGGTP